MIPHMTVEPFHTRSALMCVGNGMEGNGREEEGIKTRAARHASIVTYVPREAVDG